MKQSYFVARSEIHFSDEVGLFQLDYYEILLGRLNETTMNKAGIWLDKRNAIVVHINGKGEKVRHLQSEVDEGNISRGDRSSTPFGLQGVASDVHILDKRNQQLKEYYQELLNEVQNSDHLLIMGPAEAKNSLLKEIRRNSALKDMKVFIQSADSMTEPQFITKVRNYFDEISSI